MRKKSQNHRRYQGKAAHVANLFLIISKIKQKNLIIYLVKVAKFQEYQEKETIKLSQIQEEKSILELANE